MKIIWSPCYVPIALFAAAPLRRAPGFSLPDANGNQHDLADYRGKP